MPEENPLQALIGKWTDDDNPEMAIHNMDVHAFELMTKYPNGVPTIVLTTAIEKGVDYVGQLLAGMIVDVMTEVKGWDDEERAAQAYLSRMGMRILRGEAWIDALREHQPPPADGVGTEEQ